MKTNFTGFGILSVLLLSLAACQSDSGGEAKLPKTVDFNFHIKPILSDRCFACHGPDEKARKGDLRLDIKSGAFALLDSADNRYAIVPGDLKKSSLIQRITSLDHELVMPPPESNLTLSDYEIELLKKWIDQGAEWKDHWAFIPPEKPALPEVKRNEWPRNEIDQFVLAKLEQEGLKPESPASRGKWLRRVSFDLTGLPPGPEELEAFVQDNSEDAYEKVVDRLLADPAYGERMTSTWLDVARYADSHGYQDDRPRTMWPWRDWVIDAFNTNMPYDSFVVYQLAGDLLPNPTYAHKLATGFNRNHAITQEGGVVNEEYVTEYVADRTNTASAAFLGLTMECARCHDHKYDPISQKDYYSLFAFFNGIDERGQINYFNEAPYPNLEMEDEELEALVAFLDTSITQLQTKDSLMQRTDLPAFREWLTAEGAELEGNEELEEDLISYHRLEAVEALRTRDEVAPERPGRMNTGLLAELQPPALIAGYRGQALEFDGSNFLNLGDVGDFDWYHPFSLGAWIQAPPNREKAAGLLVRRNGEQKRGGYELALTKEGFLRLSLIHNQGAERIEVQTRSRIAPERWTHVFATYNGSGKAKGIQLFINGEKQPVEMLLDQLDRKSILNGNDLLAGNWTHRKKTRGDIHGFAGGKLDEIRVYARELSPLEVQGIVEKPFATAYRTMAPGARRQAERETLLPHYLLRVSEENRVLQEKLYDLRERVQPIPYIMIMEEMDTVRETFILARGAYDAPTEKVAPAPPASVLVFPEEQPKNRLGLAQWITDTENPLTARVFVNRLWQQLFGKGIVSTSEDFGSQGALPSHPELLDWLAVDFMENNWDIKAMLRKIALSETYRQSGRISPDKLRRDPENRLLARGPNQRLSAEMVRDNALAVSGLLVDSIGGKWVKPYQPAGIWKELANQIGENKYRASRGDGLHRRSLYSYWKRTIPPPTMLTFDASERAVCVVKRQATSTPLQSLVLLNDPQYVEASRELATRMLKAADGDVRTGIEFGFRMLTSRQPTEEELGILTQLLEDELRSFGDDPQRAQRYLDIGAVAPDRDLAPGKLAAWTMVANTLMNLDEAKMRS
ncbi:DUF1553 domain-containing protein [Flavilitoribacter nigricans]|nr:DUF1553 domain-containing protein [Flavilitoribacter nigricans]